MLVEGRFDFVVSITNVSLLYFIEQQIERKVNRNKGILSYFSISN